MLYRSLSPSEQLLAHKHLKVPPINDALNDICDRMEQNWLRSATYKSTRATDVSTKSGDE